MSEAKRDYYDILNVDKSASKSDIKKAFRRLAKQYHPDRFQNKSSSNIKQAEEKFKEASEAFDILSNDQKRSQFDRYGHAGMRNMGNSGFGGIEEIFPDLADIFSFFTGTEGSRTRGYSKRGPSRGADLQMTLDITLEEALSGTEQSIIPPTLAQCPTCSGTGAKSGTKPETCSQCRGAGQVRQTQRTVFGIIQNITECPKCRGKGTTIKHKCPECKGRGRIQQQRKIKLRIPPGSDNGSHLRIKGEGRIGDLGGESGDLYILIQVAEHNVFQRNEENLFRDLYIPFHIAALGGILNVPLLDKSTASLKIPAGTQNGEILELKGQGMHISRSAKRGNLYIRTQIVVPKKLDKNQKLALENIGANLGHFTDKWNQEPEKYLKKRSRFN